MFKRKAVFLSALGNDICLNKKTEFINKCHHQNKSLLKNLKDSMDWNLVWIFVFEYLARIVFSLLFFLWGERSLLELLSCWIRPFIIFIYFLYQLSTLVKRQQLNIIYLSIYLSIFLYHVYISCSFIYIISLFTCDNMKFVNCRVFIFVLNIHSMIYWN